MAFTQSSLAKKTIPTTKYSERGMSTITKITWHHMAGKMTAEACAKMHANGTRQASANYYIGYNGEIVAGVPESKRAWTSSSSWNDSRAITFEISNCEVGGQWKVSDKSLEAAIALSIDICKRYGITNVYFDGTKNAPLTIHKMFSSTTCPGPYLENLFKTGYIAQRINAGINGEAVTPVDPSLNVNPVTPTTDNKVNPYKAPTETVAANITKSPYIGWAQWQLSKIFGYNLVIDSVYGPVTKSALVDFQTRNNIKPANGVITKATINALNDPNSYGANSMKNISLVYKGVDYTAVFDPHYYVSSYKDLEDAIGHDSEKLFKHFLSNGMKELRQAHSKFNVIKYASTYPDLRAVYGALSSKNASKYYIHYCQYGKKEGRMAI